MTPFLISGVEPSPAHSSSPVASPAAPLHRPAAGGALNTGPAVPGLGAAGPGSQPLQGLEALLATKENRAQFIEYLARLELNEFRSTMGDYIDENLTLLTGHLDEKETEFWFSELQHALVWREKVADRDYDTAMCGPDEDHQRMWDDACARVDEAVHALINPVEARA